METPKTNFVKNLIKKKKFSSENLNYISNLCDLEKFVMGENAESLPVFKTLRRAYKKEFFEIIKEIKPGFDLSKIIEAEKKEDKKRQERLKKKTMEDDEWWEVQKRQWSALGGKI